ncbi:MAG: 2-C-methyl-D-erythritol 4-phosphate cytidylyltransferase [Bacilli bacterium]|nr:2-C-methyl-D-erythritol 4-phosphate cytidylyltransferase [Bacilli bacterium]
MKTKAEVIAVLLLGGNGTRFGSALPKQYIEINGMPLMAYPLLSLERSKRIDQIVLVVASEHKERALEIATKYGISKLSGVVTSGNSREESVKSALLSLEKEATKPDTIIMIHDGDRPNLTERIIEDNVEAASNSGAAVTAIGSKDSIILSASGTSIDNYAERKTVYRAQTPQTFAFQVILDAIKKQGTDFTDDGSIVLKNGGKVEIVEGDEANIKITTKEDLNAFLAMKGETSCQK